MVMEQLVGEVNRSIDIIVAERRTTTLEMEVVVNWIVESALQRSERLVDHFSISLPTVIGRRAGYGHSRLDHF